MDKIAPAGFRVEASVISAGYRARTRPRISRGERPWVIFWNAKCKGLQSPKARGGDFWLRIESQDTHGRWYSTSMDNSDAFRPNTTISFHRGKWCWREMHVHVRVTHYHVPQEPHLILYASRFLRHTLPLDDRRWSSSFATGNRQKRGVIAADAVVIIAVPDHG